MTTTHETATEMPNGVDVATLFATIGAVAEQPEMARFRFRASNEWVSGTHSRTTIGTFTGAGGDHQHRQVHVYDGDHPTVLVGNDEGPTPVEFLLHALALCLTAGIGNIAAARGVELRSVTSNIEGDIDLRGILGISDEVRNGYESMRITFDIDSPADDDEVRRVVEQSVSRSAVYDLLTNGTRVEVDLA